MNKNTTIAVGLIFYLIGISSHLFGFTVVGLLVLISGINKEK